MEDKLTGKQTKLHKLMSLIHSFDVLNRYLELKLFPHGINPIRFAVMNALIVHGGRMSPTDISKWTLRSPHTVTSMLDWLERDGLVKREPNLVDRRRIDVIVTDKGWNATRNMIPIVEEIGEKALDCLSQEEIETVIGIMRKLRKHLLAKMGERGAFSPAHILD